MKNFDEERAHRASQDRDFKIGGEVFRARSSVKPELLAPYESLDGTDSAMKALEVIDELLLAMIEPVDDAHARYRAIRERVEDAVSIEDLQELVKWLMEVQTARPTGQPVDSSTGRGATGTTSTGTSSSQDTPAG